MSKTITVQFDDATEDQLRQFATEALGMSIHPMAKLATIREKIRTAFEGAEFTLTVADAPAPAASPAKAVAANAPDGPFGIPVVAEPMYTIEIAVTSDVGGDQPVPVNPGSGRNMWIERGKPQRIKHRHYHALMNAMQTIYEQQRLPNGALGPMVARDALSYPVQVKEAPPQAELDAWAKYKADLQAAEVAAKRAAQRAQGVAA